jgi:hypothetical protein
MRQYLATLHKRPAHHKKRFALVTAGSFTLLIFAIWALATFGNEKSTTASANQALEEANPFGSLWRGMGAGWNSIVGSTDELKEGLEVANPARGFEEMRNNTLNTYGQ